jgi:hypothetical protein
LRWQDANRRGVDHAPITSISKLNLKFEFVYQKIKKLLSIYKKTMAC